MLDNRVLTGGQRRPPYVDTYRTRDGRAQFSFLFEQTDAGIAIQVLYLPYPEPEAPLLKALGLTPAEAGYRLALASAPRYVEQALQQAAGWAERAWARLNPSPAASESAP